MSLIVSTVYGAISVTFPVNLINLFVIETGFTTFQSRNMRIFWEALFYKNIIVQKHVALLKGKGRMLGRTILLSLFHHQSGKKLISTPSHFLLQVLVVIASVVTTHSKGMVQRLPAIRGAIVVAGAGCLKGKLTITPLTSVSSATGRSAFLLPSAIGTALNYIGSSYMSGRMLRRLCLGGKWVKSR